MGKMFRTVSHDGSIRGTTVDASDAVTQIVLAQQAHGPLAKLIGETVAGCVMVQRFMSPDQRLQMTLQSTTGRVFVDVFPDGGVRAIAHGVVALGPETILQVTRVLENGELHVGSVETSSDGLTASLVAYMQHSEQNAAMLDIYVSDDGTIVGGWMLQALPDPDPKLIEETLAHLETLPPNDLLWRNDVEHVATMVMGTPHRIYDEPEVTFQCRCSKQRVLDALRSLSDSELAEMIADETPVPIACDYCGTEYAVSTSDLNALREPLN